MATLEGLLGGGPVPPALEAVIDDARECRILSAEVLRGRLQGVPLGAVGEMDETPPFTRWPFILVGVIAFLVIAVIVLIWAL